MSLSRWVVSIMPIIPSKHLVPSHHVLSQLGCLYDNSAGYSFINWYLLFCGSIMKHIYRYNSVSGSGFRPLCSPFVSFIHCCLRQTASELFASLLDERAHFGKGVYTTQHEPAVWHCRLRVLLNNYSNGDPLRVTLDEDSRKRDQEWGAGNPQGHRAGFCVPLIVPVEMAYNIFQRQTPDLAGRLIEEKGTSRPIRLGEDLQGRVVHRNRDVWVIRILGEGVEGQRQPQHAKMNVDALANVLEKRLEKLWRNFGGSNEKTLECMTELALRYQGRARFAEAEPLFTQVYATRMQQGGSETCKSLASLAILMHEQGRTYDAEPLLRKALKGLQRSLGDAHADTLQCKESLVALLKDLGHHDEVEMMTKDSRMKKPDPSNPALSRADEPATREKLKTTLAQHGPEHPATLEAMRELGVVLKAKGDFHEAEMLFHMSGTAPGSGGRSDAQTSSSLTVRGELQKSLEKLGDMHPDSLGAMHRLSAALRREGQLVEAEKLGRKAFKGRREKLGDMHPDTLESMLELGILLKDRGQVDEAEQLLRTGLEYSRKTLGGVHQHTVEFNNVLGSMLTTLGRAHEMPGPGSMKEWLAGHWTTPQMIPGRSQPQSTELKHIDKDLEREIERVLLEPDSDDELEQARGFAVVFFMRGRQGTNDASVNICHDVEH